MKMQALALLTFTSFTSLAAYEAPFEMNVGWTQRQIRVCFGVKSHEKLAQLGSFPRLISTFSEIEKESIKAIITKEFTKESVGLEFTTWQDCDEKASNGDLIVFRDKYDDERGGAAVIGQGGITRSAWDAVKKVSYHEMIKEKTTLLPMVLINPSAGLSKNKVTAAQYIQLTALHEFGHVAGLLHEHRRFSESEKDPNCKKNPDLVLNPESVRRSTRFSGSYDFNSIMNYCFYNSILDRSGLSFSSKRPQDVIYLTDKTLYTTKQDGKRTEVSIKIGYSHLDKEAIRCLYFYDEEQKKKFCSKTE